MASGWYQQLGYLETINGSLVDEVIRWRRLFKKPLVITEYGAEAILGLDEVWHIGSLWIQFLANTFFLATLGSIWHAISSRFNERNFQRYWNLGHTRQYIMNCSVWSFANKWWIGRRNDLEFCWFYDPRLWNYLLNISLNFQ